MKKKIKIEKIIMKNCKKFTIVLIIIFLGTKLLANNYSNYNERIFILVKTWGYLKYHHPIAGKGVLNWDSVFVSAAEEVLSTSNSTTSDKIIKSLFTLLAKQDVEIEINADVEIEKKEYVQYDIIPFWKKDTFLLSDDIVTQLDQIHANYKPFENYYAYVKEGSRLPYYDRESNEITAAMPDISSRLLALARLWNVIEYFYPYKYLIEENWENVLMRYIPAFIKVDNALSYYLLVRELAATLCDNHVGCGSIHFPRWIGDYFAGFSIAYSGSQFYLKGIDCHFPENNKDILPGDVVLEINGESVADIAYKLARYHSAGNSSGLNKKLGWYLTRTDTSVIILKLKRLDSIFVISIPMIPVTNYKPCPTKKPLSYVIDDDIYYVDLGAFTEENIDSIILVAKQYSVIIFDMRNGVFNTTYSIMNSLNREAKQFCRILFPDFNYPGRFWIRTSYFAGPDTMNNNPYMGKVFLLINEYTQSHDEFSVMMLQTYDDVTLVGSPTVGADGNITTLSLPGGITVGFTGIGVEYPDGRRTQRIGLQPDIWVRPDIRLLQQGRDNVLERAIFEAKNSLY